MLLQPSSEELSRLEQLIFDNIPITRHLQLAALAFDERGLVLRAPLNPHINHKGTGFGGSLNMLTTLAGWGMVNLLVEAMRRSAQVVIQKSHIAFLQPVQQDFEVVCEQPGEDALTKFIQSLERHGMARIKVRCSVWDGDDLAVSFDGAYVALGT